MLTIFGKNNCPKCEQAKNLINMYGYPASEWEYINLESEEGSVFVERVAKDGRDMPAVYDGDARMGGVNELQKYLLAWRKNA